MPASFDATKNRTYDVRASRAQMDGEQHRRDLRAALHELQQRLGQCHPVSRDVPVVVTAGAAPSIAGRIRRKFPRRLRSLYTVFTFCSLL